jgi:hypothetical protein
MFLQRMCLWLRAAAAAAVLNRTQLEQAAAAAVAVFLADWYQSIRALRIRL